MNYQFMYFWCHLKQENYLAWELDDSVQIQHRPAGTECGLVAGEVSQQLMVCASVYFGPVCVNGKKITTESKFNPQEG